jgi:four helix bundle protein
VRGGVRDLAVYETSCSLADDIGVAVRRWASFDRWTTGVQLIRAADSIGANLAEAYGRGPFPDRRRFIFIARGSAYELEHWLRSAEVRGLECPADALPRAHKVGLMLNGLARAWRPAALRTDD